MFIGGLILYVILSLDMLDYEVNIILFKLLNDVVIWNNLMDIYFFKCVME